MLAGLPLLWFQTQLAINMTMVMNMRVDPCVDFYQYACGNYENVAKMSDDQAKASRGTETEDDVRRELREPIKPDDATSVRMTKQYYRSCIDVDRLEEAGMQPLKAFLDKYGGWPVIDGDAWKEADYDWIATNARLTVELGGSDILAISQNTDFKNASKNTLYIDQASLGLRKRAFYTDIANKKFVDAYFSFMVSTAVQLGAPKERAETELKDALEFETALANISIRDGDRRDKSALYRPMTIKELKEKHPDVNFDAWFRAGAEAGWKFQDCDVINLSGLPYVEKLAGVVSKYSKRTIANLQLWKAGMDYVDALAPSLRENYRKFREATTGAPEFAPRWQECMDEVRNRMPISLGAMYVARHFSEETKRELDTMVTSIRKAMANTIDSIDWMDTVTKRNAQKKLASMIQLIAYPSGDIYNETWVMKDYAKAEISDSAYFENKLSLVSSFNARMIREFRDPVNRTEWRGPIAYVNAWYSPEYNTMNFPAGILRLSFYHPDAPDYYNYGHIGTLMGHELTHGYDDEGRQYDENGTFTLWWTNETLKQFENGAKCFIDQYSNITDDRVGFRLNGENTQSENIADNGGLKLAFKAFKTAQEDPAVAQAERNRVLPRMSNYSVEQLFFLSYGQAWCSLMREEALQVMIISNPHSPQKYRVNVALQNNADFAQAYQCPSGSPMNPAKKCQIW